MHVSRKLLSAIAVSLSLFAMSQTFQPGALAQAPSEYQQAVAAFTPKLEEAKGVQTDLNHLVACLGQRQGELERRSEELEGLIGALVAEEKERAKEVTILEPAYNQLKLNFEAAERDVAEKTRAYENMPGRAAYEKWKKSCDPKDPGYSLFVCSYGNRNPWSDIAQAERDLPAARRRLEIARDTMNAEKQQLDESQDKLKTARERLATTTGERQAKEREITVVKRSLSDVREVVQPLRIAVDQFDNLLTEAKKVDLADERRRTLLELQSIAGRIDETLRRSHAAVLRVNSTLPAGWQNTCTAN
jgi:chromosome segregation ATPase